MYQKIVFMFYLFFGIRPEGIPAETDNEDEIKSRIFHGTPINIFDYPFFAILNGCGGAIISEWWIVTAAHCVVKDVLVAPYYPRYVCVGGNTESNCYGYTFNRIIVHPGFRLNEVKNDIAVIKLSSKLRFGPEIQKVYLPRTRFYTGWMTLVAKGVNENDKVSDTVELVKLYGYDGDRCSESGDGEGFCLIRNANYEPGTCFGDSGSPLVRDGTLIGIVSAIGLKNCHLNKYTYAVNVAYYVPWIRSQTGIY